MDVRSLGLIETWGLTAAIEAADAGTKAANVRLLGLELAGGGLVTVTFSGDVAAVQAAVSAASVAAGKVGKVVATDVIARPHEQLHRLGVDGAPRDRRPPAAVEPVETDLGAAAPAVSSQANAAPGLSDAIVESAAVPPMVEPQPVPETPSEPQAQQSAPPPESTTPEAVSKGSSSQPGRRTRRPKPKKNP